ncbi:hypothetical protein BK126_05215 [Paenibacillus sp. FSL H7-0326]|uniref:histidine kinase n=1 Tax=Paenibacillus sp. FSL H7-0326 TaxID=1921144 RepID=UPI00096F86E7|nr:histidine kinase [Paenibacillus sp. FSL H7-0326]OMC71480.1 hypothetical protein BK126_05215 [Paenibacillus sp. FSL H7-0326]
MKRHNWRGSTLSLRLKLTFSVLVMTLPLVGMLFYNNFYSIHVVREQVANSYKNSLALYMNLIDSGLNDASSYMSNVANGNDLISLSHMANDEEYNMAKVYLFDKLMNDISLHSTVSAFFIYQEQRQDYMDVYNTLRYSFEERARVQGYVIDLIREKRFPKAFLTKRWQHYRIGQQDYLIDIVLAGDTYFGAWVKTDELMGPLRSIAIGEGGGMLFANDRGEPIMDIPLVHDNGIELHQGLEDYYLSGTERKFLVVGAPSNRGNFNLVALIPDQQILANLPYLQQIIWFITFAALLSVPVGLFFIRRDLMIPLSKVVFAMRRVRGGDWSRRVELRNTSEEFTILAESFNSMMTEIELLRVNVFEEQLNKQREELQRLQLQVNPHFFLNSLNIVYNLAKVKNFDLIMKMTMSLIHYFRFLFRSNTSYVKLGSELEHTRNYLNIQELRFPGRLTWSIEAPDYLMDTPVSLLIIQSFVENSIKHGFTNKPMHISVQISFEDEERQSSMRIMIEDTGRGFDDAVLQELQAGNSVVNEKGERTGIWNVQRRLRLLYKESISIRYFNDEESHGAVVEMILPTDPEMEGMT